MKFKTFVGVGLILFIAGIIMFLAVNPIFMSLANRLAGYEIGSLSKAEFETYLRLNRTVMPTINFLIVVGITLLLMGVFESEKK